MKNMHFRVVLIVCAFAVVAGVALFAARDSRGQSQKTNGLVQAQSPKRASLVKPTVLLKSAPARSGAASSAFSEAVAENALLRNDLNWSFGSKPQHGWYLYDLLIGQTINLTPDPSTDDFAGALATWQKQKSINSTGILDEKSLMALVSQWQSNRLKDKTPATPDQLMTAPPSDFYDPQRLAELRQVEHNTYAAYKRMLAAAIADPDLNLAHTSADELAPAEKFFRIVSAFRSREYQEHLRQQSPNAGSAGLAMNSPHFTGRALDLYVGGDPVDTRDANRAIQVNTAAYKWLVRNAARFGFRPYFYEPWHWEYVG
jgi:LAS superfamily LD-carboxypeptidase LdcB